MRAPHPDDEVPAQAGGDGQGPVHLLTPVEKALGHAMLHLRTLRLAQRHLEQSLSVAENNMSVLRHTKVVLGAYFVVIKGLFAVGKDFLSVAVVD